jgi:hypothetical protein
LVLPDGPNPRLELVDSRASASDFGYDDARRVCAKDLGDLADDPNLKADVDRDDAYLVQFRSFFAQRMML